MRTINAKLYDGTPCCNNNSPFNMPEQSGWYVDYSGNRVRRMTNAEVVGYSGNQNVETPAGLSIEYLPTGPLMCSECVGDASDDMWGQFVEDSVSTFHAMEPIIRGIAMAASYIPVFGTAVSFCLNASLNLADGEKIDDAFLDSVGEALPGQPASGMAFNAARAVISGNGINAVAIAALPDPPATPTIKKVIYVTSEIVLNIASGAKVTDAALDQLSAQLPVQAQNAMSVARNLVNGMPLTDTAVAALGRQAATAMQNAAIAANAAGKDGANRFISEAGFQAALDSLPPNVSAGLKAGWTAELAKKRQDDLMGSGFVVSESNSGTNDTYVDLGRKLMSSGIVWFGPGNKGYRLLDIRGGSMWTMNRLTTDPLTGQSVRVIRTDGIDEAWRRGFDIAVWLANGLTNTNSLQEHIRASLNVLQAQKGFDAGQAIQFDRTQQIKNRTATAVAVPVSSSITSKLSLIPSLAKADIPMTMALGRTSVISAMSAAQLAELNQLAAKGDAIARKSFTVTAGRALNTDPNFRWGFDIGTATCMGNSADGPGQIRIRQSLGPSYVNSGPGGSSGSSAAINGFYAAQHLQFGITKAGGDPAIAAAASNVPPVQAAGALITAGSIGTGDTAVNSSVGTVASNNLAKAGAATVIAAKQGFFAKLLAFFGL